MTTSGASTSAGTAAMVTTPSGYRLVPPRRPSLPWRAVGALLVVVAITVVTMLPGVGVDFSLEGIIRNWRNGVDKIAGLLTPDWAFFPRTVGPLIETLQMAVIALAIAAVLSLPLAIWGARLTSPNRATRAAVRGFLNLVRAVPDLLYAAVLVAMVGVGALPGIIALVLFDLGIIAKLVSEQIEANDPGPLEAGRAAGGTNLQVNRASALPDIWPAFANQSLYTLELNVRASAVLGLVGAGGMGLLIDAVRAFFRYDQLALIILELLIVVLLIDWASSALRRRLV